MNFSCHTCIKINIHYETEIHDSSIAVYKSSPGSFRNSRESLRNVDSLKSYLFSMTHNSVLNLIKHKNIQDKYKSASAGTMSDQYEPDASYDTAELLKSIDYALDGMTALRKTIFRMNRYEHKTYQEIAYILMISPKTVQYHISCALSELRILL